METIKIKRNELLEILKKNRAKHRKLFEEAQVGYRKEAIELLDKALADAREGRKIQTFFKLEAPIDQTKDYDRAIKMIEMSVDDSIEIGERDFGYYVMDDWSWKEQFLHTNTYYANKNK